MKVRCVSNVSATGRKKNYVTPGKVYESRHPHGVRFLDSQLVEITDDENESILVIPGHACAHGLFEIAE